MGLEYCTVFMLHASSKTQWWDWKRSFRVERIVICHRRLNLIYILCLWTRHLKAIPVTLFFVKAFFLSKSAPEIVKKEMGTFNKTKNDESTNRPSNKESIAVSILFQTSL
jgi:hypothetical protein